MRVSHFSRAAFSIGLAATLLCACGGSSMPRAGENALRDVGAVKGHETFKFVGHEQTFKVPAGVKQLTVIARGGEGAGFTIYPSTDSPGRPGRVEAVIGVEPGEKLYVLVGGSGIHDGFNGGGAGGASGSSEYAGNFGGGASDVREGGDALQDRIIVAAGGGGAGQSIRYYGYGYGGNGGGLHGKRGGGGDSGTTGTGGGGGAGATQSDGGSGGSGGTGYFGGYGSYEDGQPGGNGALGVGGNGGLANGGTHGNCPDAGGGGGGGGGYYGGGGGGGGGFGYFYMYGCYNPGAGGGGAGGSSYVAPSVSASHMWTGWKSKGDGLIVFSWN